jgi:integrase
VLRLTIQGTRREMGLGPWPDVSIAEARERAAEARKAVRSAEEPIEMRRKARRVVKRFTVKEAIESCFEARQAQLKGDGEAGRWMSPMNVHVIPKLGKLAVEGLDQHRLKEFLDPIWHAKPDMARKALNRLNLTMQHCAALGLNVDLQACMKARALLGKQRHVEEHIPSLPYAEAPAFYKELRTSKDVSARALRFLMLTVTRVSEIRFATVDEMAGDIWNLPGSRTKTGEGRRIPLGKEALTVLEASTSPVLFQAAGGKAISDMAMSMFMRREGYDARPHGCRATFRTWCEECTDADYETKESCLGHAVDMGVVGAYQRSDRLEKRRKLLEQWEVFLLSEPSK